MPIATLSREEFLSDKFDYNAGEDIALFGTTGSGKTVLAHQLAGVALAQNPNLRYTVFQPKDSDQSTMEAAANLGLRVSGEYPFRKKLFQPVPRGHVFWPPHVKTDTDADIEYVSKEMKNALNAEYWKGNVLAYVDDAFLVEGKYKAATEVEQYLIAGRSSGAGVCFAMQAPKGSVRAGVSSFHYSQPIHMFFARENVQANRERYGEISMGIDPRTIEDIVGNLKTYRIGKGNVSEWLYLDRRGPHGAIVQP